MTITVLLVAVTIIVCVWLNKLSQKIGVPMLLAFIVLGMLFGNDGILKIEFENYHMAELICSAALIFIMFYGGFGTSWGQAKTIAVPASLLSTLGVVMTAGIVGLFCFYILKIDLAESFLIGAVISSTDAASVFSILRSRKLGLKNHTDSMLEVESGSNDPSSYMLTIIMLSVMSGEFDGASIFKLIIFQLLFGVAVGVAVAVVACFILRRFHFATAGFNMAFVIGVALLSYAGASALGGNGYLSAYICGIIIGNAKIPDKKSLVNFFDGITGLMQMLIFFLLGLLATPSRIPTVIVPAIMIMLFLTFVARPISVFAILSPFKSGIPQKLLVSFAGLRGAASIVFAIMAIVKLPLLQNDLFHIVFCIVLLSITFQGSLLPFVARRVGMSDKNIDVMKTFSDYLEETDLEFIKIRVDGEHSWAGNTIKEIILPPDTLIVMLIRDGQYIIPNGKTVLEAEDIAVLIAHQFRDNHDIVLRKHEIEEDSELLGKRIADITLDFGSLIILVIRGRKTIIPDGRTVIKQNDTLVISTVTKEIKQ